MNYVDTLRLNHRAKNQLSALKKRTGIEHWNVLCRWALCRSLSEPGRADGKKYKRESAVEIAWRVLVGPHGELYESLLKQRLAVEGHAINAESMQECLRAHVHRGIAYLSSDRSFDSIESFIVLAVPA